MLHLSAPILRRELLVWRTLAQICALCLACIGAAGAHAADPAGPPSATPMAEVSAPEQPQDETPPPPAEKLNIRAILVSYQGAIGAGEQVKLSQPQAKARAEQVARLARRPDQDFGLLAKRYSDAPSAEQGGVIPPFEQDEVDPTIAQATLALQPGQISEPIESPYGYYVIQRLPNSAESQLAPPEEGPGIWRSVLVAFAGAKDARPGLRRSYIEAKEMAIHLRMRAVHPDTDFAAMAREYSDEPVSAVQGGRLGPMSREAQTPQFAKIMVELQPGEVSQVIESPVGFYIFKRER